MDGGAHGQTNDDDDARRRRGGRGYVGRAKAAPAADGKLPVASADAAKEFPGAKEPPDPSTDYKVVFSVSAKVKDDEVHPTLKMIGLYLNTLAHNGVPAKNRHIAAMFHQGGGDAVFSNEVYKARHNGVDNPNIAALKELHEASVESAYADRGSWERKSIRRSCCPASRPTSGRW